MPSVAVVIPTYNHSSYILETLRSVFAQTFTDYEVIVIIDGSPDYTAKLLEPLASAIINYETSKLTQSGNCDSSQIRDH